MFAEFGETAHDQELLPCRGGVYFFVFENPGVAVGNEHRIHSSSESRIDVRFRTVADHPRAGVIAFVLVCELCIDLGLLLANNLGRNKVFLYS